MSLFSVSKEVEFDAGHRVPNHKSMCRNPHGHRYKVVATVEGPLVDQPGSSDEGMVLDFSDIKMALKRLVHDKFDHGFVVYEDDKELIDLFFPGGDDLALFNWKIIQVGFIPTAENFAKFFYDILSAYLNVGQVKVKRVDVWETPTSVATFPSYVGLLTHTYSDTTRVVFDNEVR